MCICSTLPAISSGKVGIFLCLECGNSAGGAYMLLLKSSTNVFKICVLDTSGLPILVSNRIWLYYCVVTLETDIKTLSLTLSL